MNKGKWEALPEDIRGIIRQINEAWVVKHGDAWDESDMEGLRYFLNQGGQVFGLDSEESARWKQAVAPIIEEHVEALNKKGFDGRKIVDLTVKTLKAEMD
jgi:TRAP-type C4-dicarboxylate transport system substrate-binding protein